MDANQYDSWMRRRPKPQSSPNHISDNRVAERIHPDMLHKTKIETRLDRILKPYRGRSYEGPTEPEVV